MAKNKIFQSSAISRPPVVTILGHVDHGKTTLLDTIRKTNIVQKEHGGITQHIGAYQIATPAKITFIDTPGHHAFSKMRKQGSTVADVAVLVVAANDGVKPQTLESLDHIKKAKIPYLVALNKIDLPDINQEIIKKQLQKAGVALEEYGGETPLVPISAKKGTNIDKLLQSILLLFELFPPKEESNIFRGVIIESELNKKRGISASVIARSGSLKIGEEVVIGSEIFKIRSLFNWLGVSIDQINPGDAAEILGWKSLPMVGDLLYKKAETQLLPKDKKISSIIDKKDPRQSIIQKEELPIEEQKIKLIIKADTTGTLEAIKNGLTQDVEIILSGVGPVNESDILFAKTTKALVISFNQEPSDQVTKLAQSEKVFIKTYNIIYHLFDEISDVIEAIRKGDIVEVLGEAQVLTSFNIKGDTIAGAKVVKGRVARGDQVKILRQKEELIRTRIKSLKHHKEEITKAELGEEVGIGLANNVDLLTGDSIISIG